MKHPIAQSIKKHSSTPSPPTSVPSIVVLSGSPALSEPRVAISPPERKPIVIPSTTESSPVSSQPSSPSAKPKARAVENPNPFRERKSSARRHHHLRPLSDDDSYASDYTTDSFSYDSSYSSSSDDEGAPRYLAAVPEEFSSEEDMTVAPPIMADVSFDIDRLLAFDDD